MLGLSLQGLGLSLQGREKGRDSKRSMGRVIDHHPDTAPALFLFLIAWYYGRHGMTRYVRGSIAPEEYQAYRELQKVRERKASVVPYHQCSLSCNGPTYPRGYDPELYVNLDIPDGLRRTS